MTALAAILITITLVCIGVVLLAIGSAVEDALQDWRERE